MDSDPSEFPQELLEHYKQQIPEKLKLIRQQIKDYSNDRTGIHKKALYIQVHKFAGSAGTYGYATISVILKEMELKVDALTPESDLSVLEDYLIIIEKELK